MEGESSRARDERVVLDGDGGISEDCATHEARESRSFHRPFSHLVNAGEQASKQSNETQNANCCWFHHNKRNGRPFIASSPATIVDLLIYMVPV